MPEIGKRQLAFTISSLLRNAAATPAPYFCTRKQANELIYEFNPTHWLPDLVIVWQHADCEG